MAAPGGSLAELETWRCRAPPRAPARASGLAGEAPAAAGPHHPLLLFAPAPLLLSSGSQLLPHRLSLPPSLQLLRSPPPGSHPRAGSGASWSARTAGRTQLRGAGRVGRASSGCGRNPSEADAGPGGDCTGVPSRGPGTFPARPPHSQPRRQPSWFASAALGTGSHRELGTCACSPEVSPGSLGRFPRAGWDCKLQTSATRWAEGLETRRGLRALASWNQVVEAAGGRRGGPQASAARCLLGLGTLARPLSRLPFAPGPAARGLCPAVVCASGLQPR